MIHFLRILQTNSEEQHLFEIDKYLYCHLWSNNASLLLFFFLTTVLNGRVCHYKTIANSISVCTNSVILSQVTGTVGGMQSGLNEHLSRLGEIFATRGDFVQTLQFMQQMSDNIIKQLLGLPDWEKAKVDLAAIADQTAYVEYYR